MGEERGIKRSTQSSLQRHKPQSLGQSWRPEASTGGEQLSSSWPTSIDESIDKRVAEGLRIGLVAVVERVQEMVEERVRGIVGE